MDEAEILKLRDEVDATRQRWYGYPEEIIASLLDAIVKVLIAFYLDWKRKNG